METIAIVACCSSRTHTVLQDAAGVWQRSSTFKLWFIGGDYLLWVPTGGRGEAHHKLISLSFPQRWGIIHESKEIECIISCFLKGNCVSQVSKTHSASVIEIHQRKRWTRSAGLPQLRWMIRDWTTIACFSQGNSSSQTQCKDFHPARLLKPVVGPAPGPFRPSQTQESA